jgi:hypothetical protein
MFLEMLDGLVRSGKRPMDAPLPDILEPLGNATVDDAALRRGVLIIRKRYFREDRNHSG